MPGLTFWRPMRLLFTFLLVLALFSFVPSAQARGGETTISGGRLPFALRLSPVDESALPRRVNMPPKLEKTPAVTGPSYRVDSSYWATVLPKTKHEPAAGAQADYYPEGGFVRADQGGKEGWLVIDLRQRALLDRYIRLGEKGALAAAPSEMDVLRAANSDGELVGVEVGLESLKENQRRAFWTAAAGLGSPTIPQRPAGSDSISVVLSLPEGRAVEMRYSPTSRTLSDLQGFEFYPVPADLEKVIMDAHPAVLGFAEEASPGSPIWWVAGLGVGGLFIGAAIWLQRRLSGRSPFGGPHPSLLRGPQDRL